MAFRRELPEFPRTPHVSHQPNAGDGDVVATVAEDAPLFDPNLRRAPEEKIDGSSVGMTILNGHVVLRNRDHILRKGYFKNTAAKRQFLPLWTWVYDHRDALQTVSSAGPYSVYGEWCLAAHGIAYDRLPTWFIAYDVYDQEQRLFLPPPTARRLLVDAGFFVPPLYGDHPEVGYGYLAGLAEAPSAYYDGPVEGVYIKVYDDTCITHRFKMIRPSYVRGALWDSGKITKNRIVKNA